MHVFCKCVCCVCVDLCSLSSLFVDVSVCRNKCLLPVSPSRGCSEALDVAVGLKAGEEDVEEPQTQKEERSEQA